MGKVVETEVINASAREILDFIEGNLAWHPAASRWSQEGDVYTIHLKDGGANRLRFTMDRENLSTAYHFVETSLPIKTYQASMRLVDEEDGTCRMTWQSVSTPDGVTDEELNALISSIYQEGLGFLKQHFGKRGFQCA